jgi:polysaccharide biosynthesis transport protein
MTSLSSSDFNLRSFWLPLKYHCWLALSVGGVVFALFGLAAFIQKPKYQAEGKLQFDNRNAVSKMSGVDDNTIEKFKALSEVSNPLTTELEVIRSSPVIAETIQQLNHDLKHPSLTPKLFLERFTAETVKGADVVVLKFKDTDPTLASTAINTLMRVYLASQVQMERKDISSAKQFLETQLPKAGTTVQKAETELRQFKQDNEVAALAEKSKNAEAQIGTINTQITDARSQLADVSAQTQALLSQLGMTPNEAIAAVTLSQSSDIQDLLVQIQKSEASVRSAEERLAPDHPLVIDLKKDLANQEEAFQGRAQTILGSNAAEINARNLMGALKQNLTADLVKLESTRQGLVQKTEDLSRSLERYRKQLQDVPRLEQKQRVLERNLEVAQATYSKLLTKNQEVQLSDRQQVAHARIISVAIAGDKPVEPAKGLYLFTGLLLGAALAYGSANLAESLNQSIRTVAEARSAFYGWPILGVIPPIVRSVRFWIYDTEPASKLSGVIVQDHPKAPASEAFHALKINLQALQEDLSIKTILVTSSVQGEGKSTVAANLAAAIALTGQRVLLIDANFHHPCQHLVWELENDKGLSNMLMGRTARDGAVQEAMERLDLLPAGTLCDNPAVCLDAQHTVPILRELAEYYDRVIIDTPAVRQSSDALLLGNLADGVLMTVRPKTVKLLDAVLAREMLEQSNRPLLGIIVNSAVVDQTLLYSPPAPSIHESASRLATVGSSLGTSPLALRSPVSNHSEPNKETDKPPTSQSNGSNPSPSPFAPGLKGFEPEIIEEPEDHPNLETMPLLELKTYVADLQKDWETAAWSILEQEEELKLQENTVVQLQEQVSFAHKLQAASQWGNKEVLRLLVNLSAEQERKHLLDETLIGQRRRLRQQQAAWEEALRVLTVRQSL